MAGHSQFKNIMVRKGAQDKKRGKLFTKIIREIMVAAKAGGDINKNPRLRAAVIKARQENMPKDKIENAIAKGSGANNTENYDSVRYEGYGPAGVAIIVEALTDNRNRTASNIRDIFTKHDSAMGDSGSVGFMFEHIGIIEYPAAQILEDAMLEAAIEAGADNCETSGDVHTITCTMESFGAVRDTLATKFGDAKSAKLAWSAKITAPASGEAAKNLLELVEALEDDDDVQEVYTNVEMTADTLEKLSA
ncbi:MAG: YebC/PmpR family DNA-binding transcriptional regulator [Alphaproteobacteria bacterium]|nr:YebC/PmpR family DNA-binding transcriptional regulator [Alphaproteobacteria bacterium]